MYGAIIGDLAGSIYEYEQIKKVSNIECNELITEDSFYSDDTILTIAILDSILHDRDYETSLKEYGRRYLDYKPNIKPYFNCSFGPGFVKWLNGEKEGNSIGNGAMMRISPVGFMFDTESEVIENAMLATTPSHNTEEAILSSQMVALIILYARQGYDKEEIIQKLNISLEYKPFEKFNLTCDETIGNCLYALFTSESFEESVKKVISYGGDTDTNAAIVGAMAEAMYGIDEKLLSCAKEKLPKEFIEVLDEAYNVMNKEVEREI